MRGEKMSSAQTIRPGIYHDFAPEHPSLSSNYEICTVHGVATNKAGDDKRVIIERTCPNGSPKLQHLTFEEFREIVGIGDRNTPRFLFVEANHFQD